MGQVFEEGQVDCLSLGSRQFPARRPHGRAKGLAPRQLLRLRSVIGQARKKRAIRIGFQPRKTAPPAELVQDTKVGDPEHPGTEGPPLRTENPGIAPDCEEDVLHNLLRGAAIQRVCRLLENQRGVPSMEPPQRFLPSGGELAHEFLVAEGMRRWHRADGTHLSCNELY